jgi:hypothetical protein
VEVGAVPGIASWGEDLATLLSGIAALARGQGMLLDRLSLLEQLVGTVQFDMTWVRDDMLSVHEAMDRFGDFVCDVQEAALGVEGMDDQVPLDTAPQQAPKGKDEVVDFVQVPMNTTSRGEHQYTDKDVWDRNAWNIGGGNGVGEPPAHLESHETDPNLMQLGETGRRDWGHDRDSSDDMGSPVCQQTMVSIEKEPLEEESQLMEATSHSAALRTHVPYPPMWNVFAHQVKDWRPPTAPGTETEEGWLSKKKGQWDMTNYGKENAGPSSAQLADVQATVNLNTMPSKQRACVPASVYVEDDPVTCTTGGSKNSTSQAWRGTARGRRPPAVQARYQSAVRLVMKIKFDCMVLHSDGCGCSSQCMTYDAHKPTLVVATVTGTIT